MTVAPTILRVLNLEERIVTLDALNFQKKIVAQVREQKAD